MRSGSITTSAFLLLFVLVLLSLVGPARAWNLLETEIVEPRPVVPGHIECEMRSIYGAHANAGIDDELETRRQGLLLMTYGCETGLTRWADVEVEAKTQWPSGAGAEYIGTDIGIRIRLPNVGPVRLGWEVEPEMPLVGPSRLEVGQRLLVETAWRGWRLVANPLFEIPVVTREQRAVHVGYAASVTHALGDGFDLGLDAFGDLGTAPHSADSPPREAYVFPMLGWHHGALRLSIGPGLGLTRASDPVLLRFFAEAGF